MTVVELKAKVYDLLAEQQRIQNEIQKTQEQLAEELKKEPKDK